MSAQDNFESALEGLRTACDTIDNTVDALLKEDADGKLELDDADLADLAACGAIITRTLTLFLIDTDEDPVPPKPPTARKAMDELIPPRSTP